MTGSGSRAALAFGFLAGSVATALFMTWWQSRQQKQAKDAKQEEEEAAQQLQRKLLSSAGRSTQMKLEQTTTSSSSGTSPATSTTTALPITVKGPSSSFLTDIVRELWSFLNVAGGDTIQASVEPYFKDYLPGPLKTLHFTKVDLGHNPIQMDNLTVRTIAGGMVQVDMDMIWNGTCDIQLQAETPYYGKICFGVRNLKLSGQFCLWLKPLVPKLPCIAGIQYAFVNPPHIDLKFTGLAAIADFAVIDQAVRQAIQASLLSVVLPNKSLYKMMSACPFLDTYEPPVGVVRITAVRGRGFEIERKFIGKDDIPDVYLNVTLGQSPVWRTKTIHDNLSPIWNQHKDFVLYDQAQKLSWHAWDEDKGPLDPDDDLGKASAMISEILLQPQRKLEVELEMEDGKLTHAFVTMQCDVLPWTTDLTSLEDATPDHIKGLLVVLINRGFNIPLPKETAATFVIVTFGDEEFRTKQVLDCPPTIDALNPLYEGAFEIPITANMNVAEDAKITLQLMTTTVVDPKSEEEQEILLGTHSITLGDLEEADNHTMTEVKRIGTEGASLEYRISLCGVEQRKGSSSQQQAAIAPNQHQPGATPQRTLPMTNGGHSPMYLTMNGNGVAPRQLHLENDNDADDATPPPPIGKVRVTVVKGRGLKIQQELFLIDIPDAYVNIQFGGDSSDDVWRTSTQHNTCTPAWNESKVYSLQDHAQVIALDVYDQNERQFDPDILLGTAKTTVGKLLLAGGSMELELQQKGRPTGVIILLRCELIEED